MARLIDSDSLLGKINDTAEGLADYDQQNAAWALRKYAVRDIMDAETVDAVEVVRCRECKHRYNGKDCTHPLLLSYSFGAIRNVKDNDFCSYGERKDGAD